MGGTIGGRPAVSMAGLDIAEQRAWESFLDASLCIYASLNRALSESHKLTLADVRLLDILDTSDSGSARMGDLAEQLLSLPSRVTRRIRRLEDAGLVYREASPVDGRGVLASITDQGRDVVAAARVTCVAVRERFLAPLTRPQIAALGENCRRLGAALKASGASGKIVRR